MSRWLLIIILAVIAACGPKLEGGSHGDAGFIDDELDGGGSNGNVVLGPAFNPTTLGGRITELSTGVMADRSPGTPGDVAVEDYIANKLTGYGLTVTRDEFADATGRVTQNIVGTRIGLDPTDVIVVGAHHDTLAGLPGANDNASGIVALLAIADALQNRQLQRTIIFVSFGSEEEPGLADGAKHLLASPTFPLANVVFMLNLDMVGTYDQEAEVYALGATTSDTGYELFDGLARDSDLLWDLEHDDSESDQVAFCNENIPYTYLWTSDPDCYHDACDVPDRIDTQDLGEIASLASDFVALLANTTNDLAAERKQNGCNDKGN